MKRHQIKAQWYYWFWGIATVAVVSGQIYIGNGYNKMSKSLDRLTMVFVKVAQSSR
tara:strand:- start:601 stop:768 length:168 start_codon:yes stop_codon:yes gene_type:complete